MKWKLGNSRFGNSSLDNAVHTWLGILIFFAGKHINKLVYFKIQIIIKTIFHIN